VTTELTPESAAAAEAHELDLDAAISAPVDTPDDAAPPLVISPAATDHGGQGLAERALRTTGRWVLAFVAAFAIFGVFLMARGVNPIEAYQAMWTSFAGSSNSIGETIVQTAPFLLAALAVALPARAGLFNIGGEGQLLLGAIFALGMADIMANQFSPMIQLTMMGVAGMVGGAVWAGIPALLKRYTATSEAISSLLLNYIAVLLLQWLVYGTWKDKSSLGFPQSRSLELDERFPIIWGSRLHAGVLLSVIAAVIVWAVLKYTPWGFRLRVVGGNVEAARRAGFRVGAISMSAMLAGGALAGLAGMAELSGVEGQLRPSMLMGYGFIGFLASWLVKHEPLKIIGSAFLMGALYVGANGLKSAAGLSGAAVYVLMAVLLLAILGWSQKKKVAL
jgi:general nucleoside transport system permease protein